MIDITDSHLKQLHAANILLAFNAPPPSGGRYNWLQTGPSILEQSITLEYNVGLYAGPYIPLIGGRQYCGLCSVGSFSYSYSPLPEPLVIGSYCSISNGLRFLDSTHPLHTLTTSAALFRPNNKIFNLCQTPNLKGFSENFNPQGNEAFPFIGHDVWIGANVTLRMGITIGTGAVIAAHSVVTKNVPPYAVVAGNPAKLKAFRFDRHVCIQLLNSCWWDKDPQYLFSYNMEDPISICKAIETGLIPDGDFPSITLNPNL